MYVFLVSFNNLHYKEGNDRLYMYHLINQALNLSIFVMYIIALLLISHKREKMHFAFIRITLIHKNSHRREQCLYTKYESF